MDKHLSVMGKAELYSSWLRERLGFTHDVKEVRAMIEDYVSYAASIGLSANETHSVWDSRCYSGDHMKPPTFDSRQELDHKSQLVHQAIDDHFEKRNVDALGLPSAKKARTGREQGISVQADSSNNTKARGSASSSKEHGHHAPTPDETRSWLADDRRVNQELNRSSTGKSPVLIDLTDDFPDYFARDRHRLSPPKPDASGTAKTPSKTKLSDTSRR